MRLSHAIATVGRIGHLRPAPGTWGSLAALPAACVIHVLAGPWGLLIATIIFFIMGLWATLQETKDMDDPDPSEIVVDEVVGQWITVLPLSFGAAHAGADILALWPGWIAAFLLFRLFDVWKPGPVGWADRRGDALGVMLDDVIAGILAAACVMAMAALWHGVLGG